MKYIIDEDSLNDLKLDESNDYAKGNNYAIEMMKRVAEIEE